jgi:hypothetical protein
LKDKLQPTVRRSSGNDPLALRDHQGNLDAAARAPASRKDI